MKYKLAVRQCAKHLSYRKRYLSLSSIEQVRLKKLKKIMKAFFIKFETCNDEEKEEISDIIDILICKYLSIKLAYDESLKKCQRYDRTIDSFSASDCKVFFQFKKSELKRLLPLLKFDEVRKFNNKSIMRGEEVFLRGLYELVTAETKHNIAANIFGRDWSAQSRAFDYFINHIHSVNGPMNNFENAIKVLKIAINE